jgi:enoyl-CoA hydratase
VSEFEVVRVEVAGPIATVTLNRPDALNAITVGMLEELGIAFESLGADPAVRVAVLTGAGRAFSAGVDLKALGGRRLDGGKVGDLLDLPARHLIDVVSAIDTVVIAKVNGHCYTGALEIALACDVVVVADEAVFGDTHAKWGLRPTWGMSQRLPRLVGLARARYLSYTARTFTGTDAAQWGLAALSCPAEQLDLAVADIANGICANSSGSLAGYKDLYRAAERGTLVDGLAYEQLAEYRIADTELRIARFR